MVKNSYNEDSIQKLDPLSFCRHRPDTYCGSTANSNQLAIEIISNAIDEHLIGNCDEITIDIDDDENSVTVIDNGQGILPGVMKDNGKSILEMVYGEINASGKFDKSDTAVYKISTGAFGIGASLACYLSHKLIATTVRDGRYETVVFNEGVFESRDIGKAPRKNHGVTVKFFPSEDFFTDAHPDKNQLMSNLENIACVCPELKINFNGKLIAHPNGITDLVIKNIGEKLFDNIFKFDVERGNQKLTSAIGYSTSSDTKIIAFCNFGLIEVGVPISTVKGCITKTLNKWGQDNKLLKKNETLQGASLQEGLVIAFNLVSPNIRYDSQTKVRCSSTADNQFINEVLSKEFEKWLDNNPQDGKTIIEKALLARRAAEAAKKAREAVKNGKKKDKVFKLPTKLIDAWSKNRSKCEIMIVEGDSAASPLAAARDGEWQAVFPIRGKLINCYKQTHDKLLANQEINNIIQALGLEYNRSTKRLDFDESKLRYGKIIACCDGDADGLEIKNLIFTFIWCFCPELIEKGYVYAAVPPLFRVTTKKNEYVYLRDNRALDEYKKKNQGKIKSINRAKGLGEQDSSELEYCLLNPRTRNIVQLTVSDFQKADKMFVDLYGKKVEPRVRYLMEHSEDANE